MKRRKCRVQKSDLWTIPVLQGCQHNVQLSVLELGAQFFFSFKNLFSDTFSERLECDLKP